MRLLVRHRVRLQAVGLAGEPPNESGEAIKGGALVAGDSIQLATQGLRFDPWPEKIPRARNNQAQAPQLRSQCSRAREPQALSRASAAAAEARAAYCLRSATREAPQ
nr:unnamed protein product [Rangifer tarandus platyrhynchus]